MTGKQITDYAIKDEIPDMELIRQAVLKKAQEEPEPKPALRTKAKLIALTAACFTLIFSSSAAFYAWNAGNNASVPPGTDEDDGCSSSISSSLCGLPVENFSLSDNKNNGDSESSLSFEAAITGFGDIFRYNNVACFAVVRVTDTAVKTADGKSITAGEQVSTAQVVRSVYKSPDASSIQIENDIYVKGLETGIDENSNLLRKGGVYVLPLNKKSDGKYTILGGYVFLFEIDNKGRVFSHSDEAEFKRYDGRNAEILINDLENMCSDEDFLSANSPMGYSLQRFTLAEVTLTGKSEKQPDDDFVREFGFRYDFVINDIISQPSGKEAVKLKISDTFSAHIKLYDQSKLTQQKRYLVFLRQYADGDIHINSYGVAGIDDESTIEASYIGNPEYGGAERYIFTPYNGYKISDFREKAERIAAYLQTQSR